MANVDVTRIAGNIGALNALNSLQNINKQLAIHQTRLSTGKRINSAADDPAGLTIATKMLARSEGMKVVIDNIGDASNMLSVAESGMSKMNDIMVQMRNKAEQAASDTLGGDERTAIQTQLSSYAAQIDAIAQETKWNGTSLLNGAVSKQFQTGVDESEVTTWQISSAMNATSLGISTAASSDATSNVGASANGSATAAVSLLDPFAGLSKASTGSYKLNTLDSAASLTVGFVSNGAQWGANGTLSAAAVTNQSGVGGLNGTTEALGNGSHTFQIVSYTVGTGAGDGVLAFKVDGGATKTMSNVATGANDLGGGLQLTVGDETAAVSTGSYTIGFVKANHAKYSLTHADGSAVNVDSNGANGATNSTTSTFYVAAGGQYETGIGLAITAGTIGNMWAGRNSDVATFDFTQANANSIDVSTADKAATYMTTLNTAMNTVNSAMSNLGSLMARLDFKSESLTSARVNVEASYNRIMNANMAEEQMNASKYTILQQTAVAMLAQANQAPQSLLSLFR